MSDLLAIDGGSPLRTKPMPSWPAPGDAEVAAATRVLRSGRINYWTGSEGKTLEEEWAAALGRRHTISVANGTLALEAALRGFGIGPGDEVVVPARTFIATAGAVVATGAQPVVADIDVESNCLTANTVEPVLTQRTRAVIPVHLGGWPCDMDTLMELAEGWQLTVIEDCAQAHGATYRGRPVGSLGHAAAFSFCQDKIVPVGEGGLVAMDDESAFSSAWAYRDHGKSFEKVAESQSGGPGTGFRWLHDSFGSNFRMPELDAAVARVALANLPEWHRLRTHNALRLAEGLQGLPALKIPLPPPDCEHGFYRLYALVNAEALAAGWDRDRIALAIAAEGVPCQYGTCAEIYREAAFTAMGLGPVERLPNASRVHETSLAFLVHPTLTPSDIDDTAAAVRKVMAVASA